MADLIYKEEVYAIVGAAMTVYNELGPGFLEAIYQEALEIELAVRQVPFISQQELHITYRGHRLRKYYLANIVAYDKIIVEIKALARLTTCEEAQLINYLKATGFELGLLINFGAQNKLEFKRMLLTADRNTSLSKIAHYS